eukprot:9523431-Prorocentrum_lima.AAC.1
MATERSGPPSLTLGHPRWNFHSDEDHPPIGTRTVAQPATLCGCTSGLRRRSALLAAPSLGAPGANQPR